MLQIQDIKNLLVNNENKKTIVFPEGLELKIQQTADFLIKENIANTILLFDKKEDVPSNLNPKIKVIVLSEFDSTNMEQTFLDIRKDKATPELASKLMKQRSYFGTMLVKMGEADSMLCGLTYSTADTLRPALQIIKTSKDFSIASSVLIMKNKEENYVFTDCAFNVKPNAQQLAEIAKMAATFALDLKVENPEVAMLSYSTNGSGMGEDVEKVRAATQILSDSNVDFKFEGEIQFDAAFDKEIRDKKFSNSRITKNIPDVFVFPDINAGNIGYKIAQRMGG